MSVLGRNRPNRLLSPDRLTFFRVVGSRRVIPQSRGRVGSSNQRAGKQIFAFYLRFSEHIAILWRFPLKRWCACGRRVEDGSGDVAGAPAIGRARQDGASEADLCALKGRRKLRGDCGRGKREPRARAADRVRGLAEKGRSTAAPIMRSCNWIVSRP